MYDNNDVYKLFNINFLLNDGITYGCLVNYAIISIWKEKENVF